MAIWCPPEFPRMNCAVKAGNSFAGILLTLNVCYSFMFSHSAAPVHLISELRIDALYGWHRSS